jgi:hypothetical protein
VTALIVGAFIMAKLHHMSGEYVYAAVYTCVSFVAVIAYAVITL